MATVNAHSRSLPWYSLDTHTAEGYTIVWWVHMVKSKKLFLLDFFHSCSHKCHEWTCQILCISIIPLKSYAVFNYQPQIEFWVKSEKTIFHVPFGIFPFLRNFFVVNPHFSLQIWHQHKILSHIRYFVESIVRKRCCIESIKMLWQNLNGQIWRQFAQNGKKKSISPDKHTEKSTISHHKWVIST